jgi:hypothetical protein
VSTMKSRVQRGRRKLRQALLHCCHVELDHRRGIAGFSPKQTGGGNPGGCCKSEPAALAPCAPPSSVECRSSRQLCVAQVPAASRQP